MHIMQIVEVRLHTSAGNDLTLNDYGYVQDWLTHWTPRSNIQARIDESREACLERLKGWMKGDLMPCFIRAIKGIKVSHFEFRVSEQKVVDGWFWMPSSISCCTWYRVES